MLTSFGTPVATQAELVVGNAWVRLKTTSTPCQRVWIGAPSANHPKGGTNTSDVMVAIATSQPANAAGCRRIASDGSRDGYIHVADASQIWLRGFTAGDAVEYSIEGVAQNLI